MVKENLLVALTLSFNHGQMVDYATQVKKIIHWLLALRQHNIDGVLWNC